MNKRAFTLIELLVVMGIISLLVSILLPSLSAAKELARKAVCKTNLRTLQTGNEVYQQDNEGLYAPGAANFMINRNRWFGSRHGGTGPFTKDDGPLIPYLPGKAVRECSNFRERLTSSEAFEAGNGGYGYNNNYVGRLWLDKNDPRNSDLSGNRADVFASHSSAVAFTDAAFVNVKLIEYSFCESPFFPDWDFHATPSIHFRHGGATNVVWLDTHVSEEEMSFSTEGNPYPGGKPVDFNIGWFGPDSNELFDCE